MDLVLEAYASCSSSDDDDEEDDSVDHARQAVERLLRGTLFGLDESQAPVTTSSTTTAEEEDEVLDTVYLQSLLCCDLCGRKRGVSAKKYAAHLSLGAFKCTDAHRCCLEQSDELAFVTAEAVQVRRQRRRPRRRRRGAEAAREDAHAVRLAAVANGDWGSTTTFAAKTADGRVRQFDTVHAEDGMLRESTAAKMRARHKAAAASARRLIGKDWPKKLKSKVTLNKRKIRGAPVHEIRLLRSALPAEVIAAMEKVKITRSRLPLKGLPFHALEDELPLQHRHESFIVVVGGETVLVCLRGILSAASRRGLRAVRGYVHRLPMWVRLWSKACGASGIAHPEQIQVMLDNPAGPAARSYFGSSDCATSVCLGLSSSASGGSVQLAYSRAYREREGRGCVRTYQVGNALDRAVFKLSSNEDIQESGWQDLFDGASPDNMALLQQVRDVYDELRRLKPTLKLKGCGSNFSCAAVNVQTCSNTNIHGHRDVKSKAHAALVGGNFDPDCLPYTGGELFIACTAGHVTYSPGDLLYLDGQKLHAVFPIRPPQQPAGAPGTRQRKRKRSKRPGRQRKAEAGDARDKLPWRQVLGAEGQEWEDLLSLGTRLHRLSTAPSRTTVNFFCPS